MKVGWSKQGLMAREVWFLKQAPKSPAPNPQKGPGQENPLSGGGRRVLLQSARLSRASLLFVSETLFVLDTIPQAFRGRDIAADLTQHCCVVAARSPLHRERHLRPGPAAKFVRAVSVSGTYRRISHSQLYRRPFDLVPPPLPPCAIRSHPLQPSASPIYNP